MMYEAKNYDQLLGLPGFSDQALKTHFALYQGYVANANSGYDISGKPARYKFLEILAKGGSESADFAGFKRRFGWEFNGMRLHELYFSSMKSGGGPTSSASKSAESGTLRAKIEEDFGGYDNWEKDFKATAMMRGIGWTILYYDPSTSSGQAKGKLLNVWVGEHDTGHLAGATPLLPLDVFEHAFLIDYGTKRADYIESFMKVIDWKVVEERFAQAG